MSIEHDNQNNQDNWDNPAQEVTEPEVIAAPELITEPNSPPPVGKTRLTHSFAAKATAFGLFVLLAVVGALCAAGAVFALGLGVFTSSESNIRRDVLDNIAWSDVMENSIAYLEEDTDSIIRSCDDSNMGIEIDGVNGSFSCNTGFDDPIILEYTVMVAENEYGDYNIYKTTPGDDVDGDYLNVRVFINPAPTTTDKYSFVMEALSALYSLRYWVFILGALALVGLIILFIFLMCSAGRREGRGDIMGGPLTKLPVDLYLAAWIMAAAVVVLVLDDLSYSITYNAGVLILAVLVLLLVVVALPVFCMNMAVRFKLGKWWRSAITYHVLRWCLKFIRFLIRAIASLIRSIPLIWRTIIIWCGFSILMFIFCLLYEPGARLFLWFIINLLGFPLLAYSALMLRRLLQASKALAEGDLSHHLDTSKMIGSFKSAGNNLNSIALGMNRAVDERMRSERMKTELITNVSHDIKTPLTSIINYAGLIAKEETENEKITEYAQVLTRQSERMKKLIEDLVEASKVSTGNIMMSLVPCELGVMLSQAAAEYDKKLAEQSLTLVVKAPEEPVPIMADSRYLWRIFDNLINNICKYGQPGTRVYLDLSVDEGEAVVSFKNTSRDPLNITADELMERFVRGDSSRSTEGSGLGLTIAKSLTELQGGRLSLAIDGDLFKAVLSFSLIELQ